MKARAGRDSRTQPAEDPAWCRSRIDGIEVALHVQPGARRAGLAGVHGERLKLAVAAPPVDGHANAAVLAQIAALVGVPVRDATLLRGAQSREKTVALHGDPAALRAALLSALARIGA